MADMNHSDLRAMQTLIRLVSAGARKEDVSNLLIDWNTVLSLAAEQHVNIVQKRLELFEKLGMLDK